MSINTSNDVVELFTDSSGSTRWRRVDRTNGRTVATSGEGYDDPAYAREAAEAYNPGVPVRDPDA